MTSLEIAMFCELGPQIGLGHVYRTAAVARQLRLHGVRVIVFSSEPRLVKRLFPELASAHYSLASSFNVTTWIFDCLTIPAVVGKIVKESPVRVSICPALDAGFRLDVAFHRGYEEEVLSLSEHYHCGLKWAVIPNQVENPRTRDGFQALLKPPIRVGISLGGGDNSKLLLDLLEKLSQKCNGFLFKVLPGVLAAECLPAVGSVEICHTEPGESPWQTLTDCPLVITRSGITPYEAVAAGLVPIVLAGGVGYGKRLLDERVAMGATLDQLPAVMAAIADDVAILLSYFDEGRKIDGSGARNIARKVLQISRLHPTQRNRS